MSDATFTSPASLALLEQVGWPEWEQAMAPAGHEPFIAHYRMRRRRNGWQRELLAYGEWLSPQTITDHEAACLIRHDRQAKLWAQWIEVVGHGYACAWVVRRRHPSGGWVWLDSRGRWVDDLPAMDGGFIDRDDALLAATKAALKEKK